MNVFTRLILTTVCFLTCHETAPGALVFLQGSLDQGSGTLFGSLPPSRSFTLELDYTPADTVANINSGVFNVDPQTFSVIGGTIAVINSADNDQASFLVRTSAPNGNISFSFFGSSISNSAVNPVNLRSLMESSLPAQVNANFGSGGSFSGAITAIPEPNSTAVMAGMMLACLTRMRLHHRRPRATN